MGFEPMTYHLRGGCSAWLSYSGDGGSLYAGVVAPPETWRMTPRVDPGSHPGRSGSEPP